MKLAYSIHPGAIWADVTLDTPGPKYQQRREFSVLDWWNSRVFGS